jgi:t-SNARE complex subunit (syntaxin)
VPAESRTVEEIRQEIASQRAQLESALGDLRRAANAKRKPVTLVVGILVFLLAALVVRSVVLRLRGA